MTTAETTKLSPAEFWHLLEQHDWFYSYSDDARYWRAGAAEAAVIQAALRADLSLFPLFEKWKTWANEGGDRPAKPEFLVELKDQAAV